LEEFYKKLKEFDYKRIICLDETYIYLNMTCGTIVIKKTNKYPYKRYNLLCAISADKVVGWKLYPKRKGCVKTNDILEFYDEFIYSNYKNYIVIMDNGVIHKSKIIRETIENDNNYLIYSVPYHHETNYIDEFFS
jgi:hypothetical protein